MMRNVLVTCKEWPRLVCCPSDPSCHFSDWDRKTQHLHGRWGFIPQRLSRVIFLHCSLTYDWSQSLLVSGTGEGRKGSLQRATAAATVIWVSHIAVLGWRELAMLVQWACLDAGDSGWGFKVRSSYLSSTAGHGSERGKLWLLWSRGLELSLSLVICVTPHSFRPPLKPCEIPTGNSGCPSNLRYTSEGLVETGGRRWMD